MTTNPNPQKSEIRNQKSEIHSDLQRQFRNILSLDRAALNLTADLPNDAYVYLAARLETIEREAKLSLVYLSNLETNQH